MSELKTTVLVFITIFAIACALVVIFPSQPDYLIVPKPLKKESTSFQTKMW